MWAHAKAKRYLMHLVMECSRIDHTAGRGCDHLVHQHCPELGDAILGRKPRGFVNRQRLEVN